MGGGKALVNAYYRSAEALGVRIRYDTPGGARTAMAAASSPPIASGERIGRAHLRAGQRRLRVQPRLAARSLGAERAGRVAGRCNFLIRGTRFNQGVLLRDLMAPGADTIGDPTQAHMVAIDARAPLYDGGIVHAGGLRLAGHHGQPRLAGASTTRARTSGPSATPSGAGWWRSSRARWATASSTPRPWAASCRRCSRVRRPTRCRNWRASSGLDGGPSCRPWQRLQRRLPRRHLRPCGAGRLPHRGPDAAQDALGPAHRHAAVLRLHAQAGRDLHLPGRAGRRASPGALWRQPSPNLFVPPAR
jgi:hypothetical protein